MVTNHNHKAPAPDTSSWLTRNEGSDLLGVSPNTLANYERRGQLHPRHVMRPDSRGIEHRVTVYDPKELAKLPRGRVATREPGEVAARCFELLDQGRSLREIVIELREQPDAVDVLHEKWLDMGGADLVISSSAKEALERTLGSFSNVAELVERVTKLKES